jgi:hypothetical protein
VKRQAALAHQAHQRAADLPVETHALHQLPQRQRVGGGHRAHRGVDLRQRGVAADVARRGLWVARIAHGDRQHALGGLGGVGPAADLAPGLAQLHAQAERLAHRLAGVAAGTVVGRAVDQREEVAVHALAKSDSS